MKEYGYEIYLNGYLYLDNGDRTHPTMSAAMLDAIRTMDIELSGEELGHTRDLHIKIMEED